VVRGGGKRQCNWELNYEEKGQKGEDESSIQGNPED